MDMAQNGDPSRISGVWNGALCFLKLGTLQQRTVLPLRKRGTGAPPISRKRCAILGAVSPVKLLRLR